MTSRPTIDEQLLRAEAVALRARVEAQRRQLGGLFTAIQGAIDENAAAAQESAVFANAVEGLIARNRKLEEEKAALEERMQAALERESTLNAKLARALADVERLERERLELVRPLGGPL